MRRFIQRDTAAAPAGLFLPSLLTLILQNVHSLKHIGSKMPVPKLNINLK